MMEAQSNMDSAKKKNDKRLVFLGMEKIGISTTQLNETYTRNGGSFRGKFLRLLWTENKVVEAKETGCTFNGDNDN